MGFRDDFSRWSLGRQLQVVFISSAFFLTLILVVITKFQLDWLRSSIVDSSTISIEESLLRQMQDLAKNKASFFASEITNYVDDLKVFRELGMDILGYGDTDALTSVESMPTNDINLDPSWIDYSKGAFMSREESLSDNGKNLMKKASSMDRFYLVLYNDYYRKMYMGFETDEIIYSYPGQFIEDRTFTPLVREWYYKASDNPGDVIITEPYQESSNGNWTFSVSQGIIETTNNTIFGVSGIDINLDNFINTASEIQVLSKGFTLLVSTGGILVSLPSTWVQPDTSTTSLRIFDDTITGINSDEWASMQEAPDGTRFDFTDSNGTAYMSVKQSIQPKVIGNITYYMIICAEKNEIHNPIDKIQENFSGTFVMIFWIVVSVSAFVFSLISILIYFVSRDLSKKLKRVEKVLARLIRKALFPRVTRGLSLGKLENTSIGIESLVEALKDKFHKIEDIEDSFSRYNWGNTRPNDMLLFTSWNECLYPYNDYMINEVKWKDTLLGLNNVSAAGSMIKRVSGLGF
ncbi:hypothetical protein SteCoe_7611 [Stentor coeruleus]|uniref:Cache domain-containing protein n=1 Tax=Stentor coeruleus TaxID=5963 RepID=A0A1R2CMF1_9CILI|nr:hypothetical protein SteCoe_7611 [Stentor coeruleus]